MELWISRMENCGFWSLGHKITNTIKISHLNIEFKKEKEIEAKCEIF
jgi:hypothetical protein